VPHQARRNESKQPKKVETFDGNIFSQPGPRGSGEIKDKARERDKGEKWEHSLLHSRRVWGGSRENSVAKNYHTEHRGNHSGIRRAKAIVLRRG